MIALGVNAQAAAPPYTRLYVFGDSYSDFGAGYIDGNGPTAVVYLARDLKIPFTYFGDPAGYDQGLDFAVSGGRTGEGEGKRRPTGELLGRGMRNQVDDFAALVKSGKIHFDPKQTMFFLAGGLNDRSLPDGATATNLEGEIATLYALGGRRFMVALLPNKIPAFATAGTRFNPVLAQIPAEMRAKYPDIRIANSDWGKFFDQVIDHPAQYGITDTANRCAGRTIFDENATPCSSPDTHYYYHEGHPSTAVHKAVGAMLAQEARQTE
jgi:phospholipase/lecithinase/hemolysin